MPGRAARVVRTAAISVRFSDADQSSSVTSRKPPEVRRQRADVVDEDVQGPDEPARPRRGRPARRRVDRSACTSIDAARRPPGRRGRGCGAGAGHDVGALGGERARDREPDALAGARHEGPPPGQSQIHTGMLRGRERVGRGAWNDATGGPPLTQQVERTFERTVDEGEQRLGRDGPELLATGAVGGVDISIGVFALLVVEQATGEPLLGALAFAIGFLALTLGSSELFTRTSSSRSAPWRPAAAGPGSWRGLDLHPGANLAAGWLLMLIIVSGFPDLDHTAVSVARHYPDLGIGWASLAAGIIGGLAITLMTWLQHATQSVPARLAAATRSPSCSPRRR